MAQRARRLKLPEGISPAMAWVVFGGIVFALIMPFIGMADGENYFKLAAVIGCSLALLPTPGTIRR